MGVSLAAFVGVPGGSMRARLDDPGPIDWVGRSFIRNSGDDDVASLTVMVWQYGNPITAGIKFEEFVARAGTIDESRDVSVVDRAALPVPSALARVQGRLVTWTEIEGEAAVETLFVGGYFRRDDPIWEITVIGADIDAMAEFVTDLARELTARETGDPSTGGDRWTGGLWNLLPGEDELDGDFRLVRVVERGQTYGPEGDPVDD